MPGSHTDGGPPGGPEEGTLRGRHRFAVIGAIALLLMAAGPLTVFVLDGSLASDTPGDDHVDFREVSDPCGLSYQTSGDAYGSDDGGVAIADYDRDGWPDVLALGGDRPILFENTGDGFEPSGALPDGEYPPMKSALFFDADGDGWRDLLLVPRTGELVFLENERGTFRRVEMGFNATLRWGTGATAGDYDRDGDLDVYVIQNGNWQNGVPRREASGEAMDGFPNLLFENTDGGFQRVEDAGVAGSHWTLATSFVDLTDDGLPDIHVANDYGWDRLLVNEGNGTFTSRRIEGSNLHAMASVVRDVNGDGRIDLFVTNIGFANPQQVWGLSSSLNVRNLGNTLHINRGNGTFNEQADEYGLREGGWGWAAAMEDFDNDGTIDVLHAIQYYLRKLREGGFREVETRPSLWEGLDNGTFDRRNATAAGLSTSNGRGLATFDFDRDGDQDVVIADTSGAFKLYENGADGGNWLQVRVRSGTGTAIGTRIRVVTSGETITRVQSSRSDFFSQSSRTLHFGLGDASVERLEIVRPDGTELSFDDVEANGRVLVTRNGTLKNTGVSPGTC